MADDRFTLRTCFMFLIGAAITVLFIMGCSSLWRHNFREATMVLTVGAALTYLFFRKKLSILAAIACAIIVVSAGLTAVFHPSVLGLTLTTGSLAGLVFFSWRVGKQYRHLPPGDWQKAFDKD